MSYKDLPTMFISKIHVMKKYLCNRKVCVQYSLFSHWVMSNSFVTPWTVACQAPLFMEFSRQEYWSGLPFPSPVNLPNPGIELMSPALPGGFSTTEPPGKPHGQYISIQKIKCSYPTPLIFFFLSLSLSYFCSILKTYLIKIFTFNSP